MQERREHPGPADEAHERERATRPAVPTAAIREHGDDDSGDWCAMGTGYNLGDIEGSTPTEAVARLWLALNKKAHE